MADKTELVYDLIFNTQAAQQDVASLVVQLKTVQDQLAKSQGGLGRAGTAARQAGRAFGSAGQSIQNASFQVADFATQVSGGTDVTRALAQQLPQLLGGFGALGAAIGAGVAIFGPYVGKLIETKDNAQLLDEATKKLSDVQDSNRQSLEALTDSYGKHIGVMRELATLREDVARAEVATALQRDAAAVAELNVNALNGANTFTQLANQIANYDFGRSAIGQLLNPLDEAANKVNFLRDKFGLTETAAKAAVGPVFDFSRAIGQLNTDAAAAALAQLVGFVRANREEAAQLIPLLDVLQKQFDALSTVRPATQASMGFSFTPGILDPSFKNSGGESAVRNQLNAIEEAQKRQEAAQKAAAAASKKAATEYQQFLNTIGRGTTPLQNAAFQIRQAEENLAKFQSRMTPEQLEQANIYLEGLRTKMDEIGFKEKWDAMGASIEAAKTPLMEFYDQLKQVGDSIAESFASGITDAFMAFIDGSKSAEEAFKEFAVNFLKQITQMILKATILYAIQTALGGAGGGLGGLFGGGGGIYGAGGVFRGGRELKKFANGGVVSSPTLFPMSSGAGLMGEAGPEAIIPLTRRGGKLGVEASPVNVTVINNSSAQVRTRESGGGLTIEVVEEAVATALTRGGNKIDSALSRSYGLRRAGR